MPPAISATWNRTQPNCPGRSQGADPDPRPVAGPGSRWLNSKKPADARWRPERWVTIEEVPAVAAKPNCLRESQTQLRPAGVCLWAAQEDPDERSGPLVLSFGFANRQRPSSLKESGGPARVWGGSTLGARIGGRPLFRGPGRHRRPLFPADTGGLAAGLAAGQVTLMNDASADAARRLEPPPLPPRLEGQVLLGFMPWSPFLRP